jgi:hypothetical protein
MAALLNATSNDSALSGRAADKKESTEKLQLKSCELVARGAGNVMRDS